jgi:hypothetical protein
VFAVTAFAADAVDALQIPAIVVALALFVGGAVAMAMTLVIGAGRSRESEITIGGLFFLINSAPKNVRVQLLGSFAVQVVVAFTTAGLRPYTSLAFGVLAPTAGLGLAGLWGARHGTFPARNVPEST